MSDKASKQLECPDCNEKVDRNKVKEHVQNCTRYRKKYLNNIARTIDVTSKNNLRFMFAELQLVQQKFQNLFSDSDEEQSNRKPKVIEEVDPYSIQLKPEKKINQRLPEEKLDKKDELNSKKEKGSSSFDNFLSKKKNQNSLKDNSRSRQKLAALEKQSLYLDSLLSDRNQQNHEDHQPKFDQDSVQCSKCNKRFTMNQVEEFVYGDLCLHPICKKCMTTYLETQYVKAKGKYKYPCPRPYCDEQIPYYQLAEIFGKQKMEDIDNQLNRGFMSDLITCVKCKQKFQFVKGKSSDAPNTTDDGKKLQAKYQQDYANHRFKCPTCQTIQCKTCQASPYHLGKTCQEFKILKTQKKCRYCQEVLPLVYKSATGIKAFDDVCAKDECYQRTKFACSKILKCGHSCNGFNQEKQCLPCLKQKCAQGNVKQLKDQNQSTFCNICFIEGLGNAPCIKNKCGHIFHYECVLKRLKTRWFGPRILFNFCLCPLCKVWIEAPPQSELYKILQNCKQLQKDIKDKAVKRLKYEKEDKNQKLTNPSSEYYKNEEKYAMALYAYFECWKCKKPYFGGRKNCADAMNDDKPGGGQFKPEELVCAQCVPTDGVTVCQKHGKDFISFKCKFCCSIAVWFCWGSTHFCDPCHLRQIKGEFLNKIPKDKLPKCQGPGKCPIGGNHDGSGETKSLGCSLCTNLESKNQNF